MSQIAEYIIHLMKCALHNIKAKEKPEQCTWEQILSEAKRNHVEGLIFYAVRTLDCPPEEPLKKHWEDLLNASIYMQLMMAEERKKILEQLKEYNISFILLKGDNISKYYPGLGMRRMADNDILYGVIEKDSDGGYKIVGENPQEQKKKIRETQNLLIDFMKKRGYKTSGYYGKDDICIKEPFYNFEFHRDLMDSDSPHLSYYSNPWKKAIPIKEGGMEYRFSHEDEYIFMLAHEYKHYSGRGCGIRNIADIYVFLKALENELDWEYIQEELQILNLTEFENQMRRLAFDTFDEGATLSGEQRELLMFMYRCGTYGMEKNLLKKRVAAFKNNEDQNLKRAKRKYYLKRFFPEDDFYKEEFPFFYKHRVFRPLLTIYRSAKGLLFHFDKIKNEIHIIKNIKSD